MAKRLYGIALWGIREFLIFNFLFFLPVLVLTVPGTVKKEIYRDLQLCDFSPVERFIDRGNYRIRIIPG